MKVVGMMNSQTKVLNSMESLMKMERGNYQHPKQIKLHNEIKRGFSHKYIARLFFKRTSNGKMWVLNCFNMNQGAGVTEIEAIEMVNEYMNEPTHKSYHDLMKNDIPGCPEWEDVKIWYPKRGDYLCGKIHVREIIKYGNIHGDYLLVCDTGNSV